MNMSILEIIGGILLILTCVLAVILCLLQDSKQQQNMTAAITGGANDSFYEKNEGRTKEAIFRKITRVLFYDCCERRYSFCKMIINSL